MKTSSALLVLFVAIMLLTVGCKTGTSSPAAPLFRQGDEYLQQQDYGAAIETFQSIRDQYPGTFDASYARERIAVCYWSWANDLKYKNEFVIAEYPETKYDYAAEAKESISWCYYSWGRHFYGEENYAEAMEKYQVVLTQYPESECASQLRAEDDIPDCYYGLAEQAEEQGNLDTAINNYEAILEGWSQSFWASSARDELPRLYLALASKREQESQWAEAFQLCEELMNRFPDSREAYDAERSLPQCAYEYGRLLQGEGKFQEALEKYKASGFPGAKEMMPECYYRWAQQLQEEGQYAEALEKYITIISDYPDSDWASWEKGEILKPVPPEYLHDCAAELGVSEAALRLYQAILDYHPESDYLAAAQKAMVDIGIALIMGGEYGTLPPATSEGSITAGGTAVIEMRNGTPYTLLVLFKGPETRVVYLGPDPDAKECLVLPIGGITEYTEETIKLPPGEYQIGARVSKTSIAPWYGTDSFQSNEQYSQIFYIRVTFG